MVQTIANRVFEQYAVLVVPDGVLIEGIVPPVQPYTIQAVSDDVPRDDTG